MRPQLYCMYVFSTYLDIRRRFVVLLVVGEGLPAVLRRKLPEQVGPPQSQRGVEVVAYRHGYIDAFAHHTLISYINSNSILLFSFPFFGVKPLVLQFIRVRIWLKL